MSASSRITTASNWRRGTRSERRERAEALRLPSGALVRVARPKPLEWILAGRLPQRLLGAALGDDGPTEDMSREEILELAHFVTEMIRATVVEPAIGEGPEEIPLEDIPLEDRVFIFEWACRSLDGKGAPNTAARKEDPSVPPSGIERFRAK